MSDESTTDLSAILRRVRNLLVKAEHEGTPAAEAETARRMADAMMLKYAVDQAMLDASRPEQERGKPGILVVETAGNDDENTVGYVDWMAEILAQHCRCKLKSYYNWDRENRTWTAKVYGFDGDLRYFEVLYTTARLHMLEAVRPRYQANLTLEENAYRLHNAGFNWLEISTQMGWKKVDVYYVGTEALRRIGDMKVPYYHSGTDVYEPATQVGSRVKRAYHRAVAAKGEKPTVISANGAKTYRRSAMSGYINMLRRRVWALEADRDKPGKEGEVVLASQALRLEDFYREDNAGAYSKCPRCQKLSSNPYECEFCGQFIKERPRPCPKCEAASSGHCRDHPKGSSNYRSSTIDSRAYQRGSDHAKTLDLTGRRSTQNRKPEIG